MDVDTHRDAKLPEDHALEKAGEFQVAELFDNTNSFYPKKYIM